MDVRVPHKDGGYEYAPLQLRDLFAAAALLGLTPEFETPEDAARAAYVYADAMLHARGA